MKKTLQAARWAALILILILSAAIPEDAAAQRSGERAERQSRTDRKDQKERASRRDRDDRQSRADRRAQSDRRPNVRNERARRGERGPIRVEKSRKSYKSRKYVPRAYHRPVHRHYTKVRVSWPVFVHIDARWHRSRGYADERLSASVDYRHRVVYSDAHMTVLRIEIEEIDIHERGRYRGEVHRIPREMRTIEATVYRNGDVEFDRDIYVTGDSRRGYRLVVDDGYGYRIGYVDLRRGRVSKVYHADVAPRLGARISLLPDDADWLY